MTSLSDESNLCSSRKLRHLVANEISEISKQLDSVRNNFWWATANIHHLAEYVAMKRTPFEKIQIDDFTA